MANGEFMKLNEWLKRNADKLGSKYERYFVERVLTRVSELDIDALEAQMPFRDRQGGRRYCDFAIREGEGVRIVLEVDGYDKTGRGTGMTYDEFEDWQRRQNALETQGWRVLRFANRTVMRRAEECAEHINLLLREERHKESHRTNLGSEVEKKEKQLAALKSRLEEVSAQKEGNTPEMRAALNKQRELQEELSRAKQQLGNAKKSKSLKPEESKRLGQLNDALKKRNEELERELTETKKDGEWMKTTIYAFTALIAVVIVVLIMQLSKPQQTDVPLSPEVDGESSSVGNSTEPGAEPGSSCRNPLDWREADNYLGARVSVVGPAVGTAVGENVNGRPTWINVGEPFPSKNRLSLVIWQRNINQFRSALEWNLSGGQLVCATGEISEYRGVPQIELTYSSQLEKAQSLQ